MSDRLPIFYCIFAVSFPSAFQGSAVSNQLEAEGWTLAFNGNKQSLQKLAEASEKGSIRATQYLLRLYSVGSSSDILDQFKIYSDRIAELRPAVDASNASQTQYWALSRQSDRGMEIVKLCALLRKYPWYSNTVELVDGARALMSPKNALLELVKQLGSLQLSEVEFYQRILLLAQGLDQIQSIEMTSLETIHSRISEILATCSLDKVRKRQLESLIQNSDSLDSMQIQ